MLKIIFSIIEQYIFLILGMIIQLRHSSIVCWEFSFTLSVKNYELQIMYIN